mgnify:CR=1 FL=1
MALLTPNSTYKVNGVTIKEKIIPDGTKWQNANSAAKAGFSANALYKKQAKLTKGTGKATSVTIHNTDDLPGVEDDGEQYVRATYNENMGSVRVHFYVDDLCAWQEMKAGTGMCNADPLGSAEVSWHAGDGSIADGGNMTSISMEIIMNDTADHDAKAYDNGARIAAWMLWRHGLTLNDLVTHTYWVNKSAGNKFTDVDEQCTHLVAGKKWCPTYIFKSYNHDTALANWKTFKAVVGKYLSALNGQALNDSAKAQEAEPTYAKGSSNEQTVYNFLTSVLGLNKAGACGVLANIQCESAFKPDALGDSGTSYGICQWHAGRYAALKTWCASNGKNYQTLDGQLWYLKYELERSYTSVLAYIRAVEDTAEGAYNAGHRWCAKFEIPANTEVNAQKRGELAKGTYWTKYNRTSGSSSVTLGAPGNVSKNDLVSLSADAKYYSGATMPDWVKNQNWYVTSVVGDRAVLGQNESGKNNICSPVNTKYLTALKPTGSTQSAYVPAVGDLVYYNGNVHYTAADATTAKPCVGGQARITRIYKLGKSKHPYSLVRVAGKGATVWGWVDEGTFTKV